MSNARRFLVGLAFTALIAGGRAFGAQDDLTAVVLDVDDYAEVPPGVLKGAVQEASRIYAKAGIRLLWAGNQPATELAPSGARRLRVLLLGAGMSARKIKTEQISGGVLGVASHATGRAYVFVDRVMTFSTRIGSPSLVLGRVIAHEAGHLLLADRGHSRRGLMNAKLEVFALGADQFTIAQQAAIQATLSAGQ